MRNCHGLTEPKGSPDDAMDSHSSNRDTAAVMRQWRRPLDDWAHKGESPERSESKLSLPWGLRILIGLVLGAHAPGR